MLHPMWIEFKGRARAFAADQVSMPYLNPSRLAHDPCPFEPEPGSANLQFHESFSGGGRSGDSLANGAARPPL